MSGPGGQQWKGAEGGPRESRFPDSEKGMQTDIDGTDTRSRSENGIGG